MGWEYFGVVIFDFGLLLQGQTRTPKFKSAYNSLIIGPRCLQCETNLKEIMGWESFDMVRFDLEQVFFSKFSFTPGVCIVFTCAFWLSGQVGEQWLPTLSRPDLRNHKMERVFQTW